jgi:hypothetical protein
MKTTRLMLRPAGHDGAASSRIALPVRFAEERLDVIDLFILRKEKRVTWDQSREMKRGHLIRQTSLPW